MFKCDFCKKVSKPKDPSYSWVLKKNKKNYELLDKKGERIAVSSGWEMKKQSRICANCYDKILKQQKC